jgi:serine/threonine-protein kinase RsbW
MSKRGPDENFRRVLGRVAPSDFVGRVEELDRIVAQAAPENAGRGLLLLMEPSAGVSELLRQAYDRIFNERSEALNKQSAVIPVYFAFTLNETTSVSAAIEFLNTFLQQYIAYQRNEPFVSHAALTLYDLLELAPAEDHEWIEQLVESYKRIRFSNDDKALVRFCLGAPQRIPAARGRALIMFDGAQLADYLNGTVVLGTELLRVFGRGGFTFVLAGLRRQILAAAHDAELDFQFLDRLDLNQLDAKDASLLVEHVARRQQVGISEQARDLLVQQFNGSPFFIGGLLKAAREKRIVALNTYLDCERLYIDELFGGYLHRHFADLFEEISPRLETSHLLLELLWEAVTAENRVSSFDNWRKRLKLSVDELQEVLHRLHVQEFVNWNGTTVEAGTGPQAWKDYLKIRRRLDIVKDRRARVVAEALTEALKRAPHTMARHYKQNGRVRAHKLVSKFNLQRVPAVLFHYADFKTRYKGEEQDRIVAGLDAETDLLKLPQTVHLATCAAFNADMQQRGEDERCYVAHAFTDGTYSDAQEVVWLVGEIESKLEVDAEVARAWCERFDTQAKILGLGRFQIWLTSEEGFSDEAVAVLANRGPDRRPAFGSSRQQLELLVSWLNGTTAAEPGVSQAESAPDEFLVVVPMGEDNELIAANTAELIARRMTFQPEAINQIKTAIVEACINASEHSFSPDQKIYQRFRVESDRLVVTISSRGIVPTNLNGASPRPNTTEAAEERRGWGLKLIRTLMDEVEFERVDDGTSLRMTKYVREPSS